MPLPWSEKLPFDVLVSPEMCRVAMAIAVPSAVLHPFNRLA
jgi:hypothetical protein